MIACIDSPQELEGIAHAVETPFGRVTYRRFDAAAGQALVLSRPAAAGDTRAVAYAARSLGATRAVSVVRDTGCERPVMPSDYVEFTSGRPTTFFENAGAGYVSQDPPYCPEMGEALLKSGAGPGGVLLVADGLPHAAVRAWWSAHGVALFSVDSQPEGALCRELELCLSVLALPRSWPLDDVLVDLLAHAPDRRGCVCGRSMAVARKLDKLPEGWFKPLENS